MSFFPKADAAVLQSKNAAPRTPPQAVGPVFDVENAGKPIDPWSLEVVEQLYLPPSVEYAPAGIPEAPVCLSDRYLHPLLTRNERLRLTILWYYTRDLLKDNELLSRLQEKTKLANDTVGWEFVIVGLLDINIYTRLATYGLPLAILPRRESTCAHTVNQPPGTVFLLNNMANDWRFQASPHVDIGGLRAYAGVPLRFQTEFGDWVALGSLCVASNTPQMSLDRSQQVTLARLADWVVADIVHSARARRHRERRQMSELIADVQKKSISDDMEDAVMEILKKTYPNAIVNLQTAEVAEIHIEGREPILPADLEGGLWEDLEYLDDVIANHNQQDLPMDKVIRIIAAQCEGVTVPLFLVVASKDFRLVFDDIDAWFVQTCANLLSRSWHKRLLAEALRAKEKFIRGMTHQLRTPIHGILGAVDLLAEQLDSKSIDSDVSAANMAQDHTGVLSHRNSLLYVDTIKKAGRDLISIVNSIITLNRWADVATRERVNSPHNIHKLETDLSLEISKATSGDHRTKSSIFLSHNLPPTCDTIWIDFSLLKDCLLPLALNAVQNTHGGIVMITASASPDYQQLLIDVVDTGCGIRSEDHSRIFDAYEKVDPHSTGAGLGLTLASKFASLLGGSVELVSSSVNQGSHFQAKFHDIGIACSHLARGQMKDQMKFLPSTFYVANNSTTTSLCSCFKKFLTSNGFTASPTADDSFLIIDWESDQEGRKSAFTKVPAHQVAICLIPASEDAAGRTKDFSNIVFFRSPFLTSRLTAVLEEADIIMSKIKTANNTPSQSNNVATDQPTIVDQPNKTGIEPTEVASTSLELIDQGSTATSTSLAEVAVTGAGIVVPIYQTLSLSPKPAALLVDDNAINLRVLQMYCQRRGLPYFCATDGQQAFDIYSSQEHSSAGCDKPGIELVLMDLQMPVCDGIEATRKIRALEKQQGKRRSVLFIVTGQDSLTDRTSAEAAGADDFLVKPVGIKALDQGLRRFFPAFKDK